MTNTGPILVFALTALLTGVMVAILPLYTSRLTPLGVRIPHSRRNDPTVRHALRGFAVTALLIAGVTAAAIAIIAVVAPSDTGLVVAALFMLPMLVAQGFALFRHRATIARTKEREDWFAGEHTQISGVVTRSAWVRTRIVERTPATSTWVFLVVSALILAATVLYIALVWDSIPERFPTHWDSQGEINQWSTKSIGSVFALPLVSGVLLVVIVFAAIPLLKDDYGIRSAGSAKEKFKTLARNRATLPYLGASALVATLMMCYMSIAMVYPPLTGTVGSASFIGIATLLVLIGFTVAASVKVGARVDDAVATGELEVPATSEPDNDDHFIAGFIYSNPDDPAILVDKRYGVGYSLNWAHWQAKAHRRSHPRGPRGRPCHRRASAVIA